MLASLKTVGKGEPMKPLYVAIHPDIKPLNQQRIMQRKAARAIAMRGEHILLLYTERHHDYSLPGGGLESNEDVLMGMIRELQEETGAQNVRNIQPFGLYKEFRPWHKQQEADVIHMVSYCYCCEVDEKLGQTQLENYEQRNGMKPMWVNIHEAIAHNEQTLLNDSRKGMSIERETYLLRLIAKTLH
ncbi:NUDIX domain-containing protein [Vibrio cholerae]|nr:NUDIX domain-containing protein [Vibrio cholerae]EGR0450432.1 NUDIX domain-containing protein [Vibrio cholerae]MBW5443324.1 NUDIX domain-containing protein [Vibrio cholerae]